MKHAAICLLTAALALGFTACEGKDAAELPEHYRHRGEPETSGGHDKAPAHGAEAAKPGEGIEKKDHR
jgi:hypothetical protein